MKYEQLYKHYKSARNMAIELGFAANTPLGWKKKGYIPIKTQMLIELYTKGLFKASTSDVPCDK